MGRNIILCADGTGNKGGSTPDSNAFRMFNAIDIHNTKTIQHTFYDNGVGTSKNDILRAIGGGLGFGFRRNVLDLYQLLAQNYQPGDRIYLFGYSRGAATIRALTGFIGCCGLIKGNNLSLDEIEKGTQALFKKYKNMTSNSPLANHETETNYGAIPIEFVGVWDTVSALGFPKNTDVLGPFSWLFNSFFSLLDFISNIIFPHNFYQYRLFDNIKHAYQALAVDDERTAFQPIIWDETNRPEGSVVEQVWFPGMHANVGGGYERDGLAHLSLYWMMTKAKERGLIFKNGALQDAQNNSNISGHMQNSRSGLGVYYRYHPREIAELCKNKVNKIKIHYSVLERMSRRTADYAPGNLPDEFTVIQPHIETETVLQPGADTHWSPIRKNINRIVMLRKECYMLLVASTLTIVGFAFAFYFWNNAPVSSIQIQSANIAKEQSETGTTITIQLEDVKLVSAKNDNKDEKVYNISIKHSGKDLSAELKFQPENDIEFINDIANTLTYFTPQFFDDLIHFAVVKNPVYFVGALTFGMLLLLTALILRKWKHQHAIKLRQITVNEYKRYFQH